jgi:Uma2 family endonuclease
VQISREKYHALLEQQTHGRFERIDGEVIGMPPELVEHKRVKAGSGSLCETPWPPPDWQADTRSGRTARPLRSETAATTSPTSW